jgi:uncharacterized membrane protein
MKSPLVLLSLIFILLLFSLTPFVSASANSSYYLEFNQISNKVVVRESVNGINSSYTDSNLLEETKIGYLFLKKIVFPSDFDNAKIKINLEEGFVVGEDGAYPSGYKIETDEQAISLIWEFNNVQAAEPIAIFVNIRDLHKGYNWIWFVLGFALVILIAYGLFFYFFRRKKINKNLDKHLLDEERKVLEELRKSDRNEMWQKNIQKNLGLSKAKTSRLVRNLESRELVQKIGFGNTNKIVLK